METFDVLILGGGVAGTAAAWAAARKGASVLVIEESPWLGGMLTAAGVSAVDGNEGALGSGFYRRFRDFVEAHYGGPEHVRTGWVSNTCFEPHVGARYFADVVSRTGARVLHGARMVEVLCAGRRVVGARIEHAGQVHTIRAHVTIEATEYGDVLAAADVPFRFGRESRAETGEPDAPEVGDLELQDPTFVAVLARHAPGGELVPRPAHYDPREFDCSTAVVCSRPDPAYLNHGLHDWDSFIGYGALPNQKFMLNWPFHSNDMPNDIALYDAGAPRGRVLERAKQRTLAFVHYMQHDLGHPEWTLATDEFGTRDHLPFMPYVRESRRVIGVESVTEGDVVPISGGVRPPIRASGIAVGDYFIDHHHAKAHLPPDRRLVENYPKNAPFQIPLGALIPRDFDGLIAAEKSFGVTHIANGCTRLQPVVMQVGHAAGILAALAAARRVEPRDVPTRDVQLALVDDLGMLVPFHDVGCDHPEFARIQRGFALGEIDVTPRTPLRWSS